MNDQVEVQLQDSSGNWRTMAVTVNVSAMIRAIVEELPRQFPEARVRTVNRDGRLVNMA